MQKKSDTYFLTDGPKLNIFRPLLVYLFDRESNAFLKSMSRIRDSSFFLLADFMRFRMLIIQDPITLAGIRSFVVALLLYLPEAEASV